MRLMIEIPEIARADTQRCFDRWKEAGGKPREEELLKTAFVLYQWMMEQRFKGHRCLIRAEDGEEWEIPIFPTDHQRMKDEMAD